MSEVGVRGTCPRESALDPDAETSFKEHGYAIIRGAFRHEEVTALKEELRRVCVEHGPDLGLGGRGDEALRRILCIHHPHKISPALKECASHPALVQALVSLVGPSVKCVQSQAFVKPPSFPGNAWHQDERHIPTRDKSLVAAWIALDDATSGNGCLRVVPRTHRPGYIYPEREHGDPEEFDFPTECYGFDESKQIPLEVEAGTAILFDGYLVHGSRRNDGSGYRRALTYHYMNAYSLLPWRIPVRPDETEARGGDADYRDVFMVAGNDPYEWKGYEDGRSFAHLRECHSTNVAADANGSPEATLPPLLREKVADALRRWPGNQMESVALLHEALLGTQSQATNAANEE